jgi:acyl-CoA reductase-like NAD-dependent aldehyde dehydrogenase
MHSREEGNIVAPLIDGAFAPSSSDATLQVVDPSNGRRRLSIPEGTVADVDRAVRSARAAFEDGRWSETPPSSRKTVLHRWADLIAAQTAVLDALDAGEMGKPVREQFCNSAAAANLVRFQAEAVDKLLGDVYTSDKNTFVAQRRVPRGVVAAVVPWNFPTYNALLKVAPALAAGNCVVLKPSEMSSRSAFLLARLALDAGLPAGVLNVIPGLGETVGRALGLHDQVNMVAFTGSSSVGKKMLQYAGQSNMKVVVTECGGKSPHIVFDDGLDLDAVAKRIAQSLLTNQGQVCSVGSRLLVQRSVEKALLDRIAVSLTDTVIGNALDPDTTFGPVVSVDQCDRVMRYINEARSEGAQLVVGGRRVLQESGGFFVEPTLFRDVSPASRIAQEEIFGPVLSAIPFDDEADAIRIANDTIYGLVSYVWTASLSTGMRMARKMRSSAFIYAAMPAGEGAGHAFSYEPAGQSGFGTEGGLAGIESYMRRQLVWFAHA